MKSMNEEEIYEEKSEDKKEFINKLSNITLKKYKQFSDKYGSIERPGYDGFWWHTYEGEI